MSIVQFAFDQSGDVGSHIKDSYGYDGDLLSIFAEHKGKLIHKWHHYIPLYDKYFSRFRGKRVRMLEIGVSKGGSLAMWRKYFGGDAIIYGIDIDPSCAAFNGHDAQVRIGSQDDSTFLETVVAAMGGIDIVLDDGSHVMSHVKSSLMALFPLLSTGGIYFIEDLHTCYWSQYGGGYNSRENFFHVVGELINDMHHWYHGAGIVRKEIGSALGAIHIHDSIVALEKQSPIPPVHSQVS
jgi:hypothetical protein